MASVVAGLLNCENERDIRVTMAKLVYLMCPFNVPLQFAHLHLLVSSTRLLQVPTILITLCSDWSSVLSQFRIASCDTMKCNHAFTHLPCCILLHIDILYQLRNELNNGLEIVNQVSGIDLRSSPEKSITRCRHYRVEAYRSLVYACS